MSGNSVSLPHLHSQKPQASGNVMLRKVVLDTEFLLWFGWHPSRFGCDYISTLVMVPLALFKWVKSGL